MDVRRRVSEVRKRIASVGDPASVRIIAVTKGFGANAVDAALRAGITEIGESYAQELAAKAADVTRDGANFHFIGRLQTNKVRQLTDLRGLEVENHAFGENQGFFRASGDAFEELAA